MNTHCDIIVQSYQQSHVYDIRLPWYMDGLSSSCERVLINNVIFREEGYCLIAIIDFFLFKPFRLLLNILNFDQI